MLNDWTIVPAGWQPRANGFALAIAIMAGMVLALIYTGLVVVRGFRGARPRPTPGWRELSLPLLTLTGLAVSGYLTYVELRAVPAVCGPIGDCNAVQSSPYARLFGVVPVGVAGAMGYGAILMVWLWGRFRSDGLADHAPLAVFCLALFGTLLSLYLTYLEPFVIRAVCLWCLISAINITVVMLLSTGPMLRSMATVENETGSADLAS